jgi:hypothetical protein
MKYLAFSLLLSATFTFTVCAQGANTADNPQESDMKIKITVGGKEFTATLYNNQAAEVFVTLLPMTVNMTEMSGQEKYYNLPNHLPGSAVNPGKIHEGDIMIWSGNCLVLFYTTFSTSYSYIRLGRVDNVSGFRAALGVGSINVAFETLK